MIDLNSALVIDSAPFSQTWVGELYKAVKLAGVNGLLSFPCCTS